MKIISRYEDFYDWSPSCTFDDNLIYERKFKRLKANTERREMFLLVGHREFNLNPRSGIFMFRDAIDLFLEKEGRKFWESIRVEEFMEYKRDKHGFEQESLTQRNGILDINELTAKYLNWVQKIEVEGVRKRFGIEEEVALINHGVALCNFSFMRSGIGHLVDGIDAAWEIEKFLVRDEGRHEIEDRYKIEGKGFDGNSFRKRGAGK